MSNDSCDYEHDNISWSRLLASSKDIFNSVMSVRYWNSTLRIEYLKIMQHNKMAHKLSHCMIREAVKKKLL